MLQKTLLATVDRHAVLYGCVLKLKAIETSDWPLNLAALLYLRYQIRFGISTAKDAPRGGEPPHGTSMWRLEVGIPANLHFCSRSPETDLSEFQNHGLPIFKSRLKYPLLKIYQDLKIGGCRLFSSLGLVAGALLQKCTAAGTPPVRRIGSKRHRDVPGGG